MHNFEIEWIDLNNEIKTNQVKTFLKTFDLDYENVDATMVIYSNNQIIATCSKLENLIKCIAIDDDFKNHNLANLLIGEISKMIYEQNYQEILVITKTINKNIFLDLNFKIIILNDEIIFLTSDLQYYLTYKKYLFDQISYLKPFNKISIIVMNANPFTKGHEYLINQAIKKTEHLFIIVVKENKSLFIYEERKKMIELNTKSNNKITVLDGSDYIISNKIFPTYFAKNYQQASEFHAKLDAQIFCDLIEPFKNNVIRYVGDEPFSKTTNTYNQVLKEVFKQVGVGFKIIKRLKINGVEVSASTVRKELEQSKDISKLVPISTLKFINKINIQQRIENHQELIDKNN